MSNKRIEKKKAFRYEVEELRSYVMREDRSYPAWRLERLQRWGVAKSARLSRYKAARMVRARNREEAKEFTGMVLALTKDMGDLKFKPRSESSVDNLRLRPTRSFPFEGLQRYNYLLGWSPKKTD